MNILQTTNLHHIPLPGPTRVPDLPNGNFTSPDKLLGHRTILNRISRIDIILPPNSDHCAVLTTIDTPLWTPTQLTEAKLTYKYHEANWDLFKEHMTQNLPQITINNKEDINTADTILLEATNNAKNIAIPSKMTRPQDKRQQLPQYVLNVIKTKRRAYRLYQKQPTDGNRRLYRQLTEDVKQAIEHYNTKKWTDYINQINDTHKGQQDILEDNK